MAIAAQSHILKTARLATPLGDMMAVADENVLYLLEFIDRRGIEPEVEKLKQKMHSIIVPGTANPIVSIEDELNRYFSGKLSVFKTPIYCFGSPFQRRVWEELQKIPLGKTCSYAELANAIERPTAYRAVAQANSTNHLAIVVPCHRVINANGALGGYSAGLERKKWLLNHERVQNDHSWN